MINWRSRSVRSSARGANTMAFSAATEAAPHRTWPRSAATPAWGRSPRVPQSSVDPAVPPFVGLAAKTGEIRWSDSGKPGFLGSGYSPRKPGLDSGMSDMKLNDVSVDRLRDRRDLLLQVDKFRREVDGSGMMNGMDVFEQRALDVLTSSRLLEALDLSKEDPAVVARYGDGKPYQYQYDGAPTCNDQLLLARRLVEAEACRVTLSFGRWDSHGREFPACVRFHGEQARPVPERPDRRPCDAGYVGRCRQKVVWCGENSAHSASQQRRRSRSLAAARG